MIPKIIHYCWFGKNDKPEKVLNNVKNWKEKCPNYKIIEWNEDNYDVKKNRYMYEAYKSEKWAYVSDYARLDILNEYGGIYLDVDVELFRSLDELLKYDSFFALEKQNAYIATGLGFGCNKNNIYVKELLDIYEELDFIKPDGEINLTPCTHYTTEYFVKKGFVIEDRTQFIGDTVMLESSVLCPMDYKTGRIQKNEKTIGIHWYEASWQSESDRKIHKVEIRIKTKLPLCLANPLCMVYRKSYRFFEYIRKGILLKKIKSKLS